jgi:hypothetical protein
MTFLNANAEMVDFQTWMGMSTVQDSLAWFKIKQLRIRTQNCVFT